MRYWARRLLRSLLRALSNLDELAVFQEPVDTAVVVDYLRVIARPMDFATMRRALYAAGHGEGYADVDALLADFALLCENATRYNPRGTVWHDAARKLPRKPTFGRNLTHGGFAPTDETLDAISAEVLNIT